jgi:hypothetical protein
MYCSMNAVKRSVESNGVFSGMSLYSVRLLFALPGRILGAVFQESYLYVRSAPRNAPRTDWVTLAGHAVRGRRQALSLQQRKTATIATNSSAAIVVERTLVMVGISEENGVLGKK